MATQALKQDLAERARERFKRTKRLEWSIQVWGDRQKEVGLMIDLLKDALNETKLELSNLEQQLGYRMKDREDNGNE